MNKKWTYITGASSGLGESAAIALSRTRNVILSGRNEDRLIRVGKACAVHGHEVLLFPYDLVRVDTLGTDLITFLKKHGVSVEAFAHFAGMTEVMPMARSNIEIGLEVMKVNYFAATEIISTLLKKRVNDKNLSSIVLVSSICVMTGKKYQPHYCASKGALEALTRALACELAPLTRVNCIAPGSFNTPITHKFFSDVNENVWNPHTLLSPGT